MAQSNLNMDYSKYDFKDSIDKYVYLSKKGLARETVEEISRLKDAFKAYRNCERGFVACSMTDIRIIRRPILCCGPK